MYFSDNAVMVISLTLNQKSHEQHCALGSGYYGAACILLPTVQSSSIAAGGAVEKWPVD